jgi:hypothetical protein
MVKSLEEVIEIKRRVQSELEKIPGVNGVGAGYKEVGEETTDELSIRVYVDKKRENVPDSEKIPTEINGVKTDVIQRDRTAQPYELDRSQIDPLKGGISVFGKSGLGTIGAVVTDNTRNTGELMIISNFHVLAAGSTWPYGDPIYQGDPQNGYKMVGRLTRGTLNHLVDAAVACIVPNVYSLSEVNEIGPITGYEAVDVFHKKWLKKGLSHPQVKKRGIATKVKFGTINDFEPPPITYDYTKIGRAAITAIDQLQIKSGDEPFSAEGDSGSAILDDEGKMIGLLVAGANDGFTYANRIENVLYACQVSIHQGNIAVTNTLPC